MAPKLTIIIPAKHEEHSIGSVVASVQKQVKTPHRIIVVCDTDAEDQTPILVPKDVRVIHRINAHGTFGSALALGITATKTPYIVPVMADSCDDPADIDRMFARIRQGWDVVCASRYMNGGKKSGGPKLQSFFSGLVCMGIRLVTGVPTNDISNAFKLYKTATIKNIMIPPDTGVEASMLLTLTAYFSGANITEIPTVWTGRTLGKSKFFYTQRAPRYLRICLWALYASITRLFRTSSGSV